MAKQVILEFPDELPDLDDQDVIQKGKEAIVTELLPKGKISQGKAVELLEISRYDFFDLMAKYKISMADFPPEELRKQREDLKKVGGR